MSENSNGIKGLGISTSNADGDIIDASNIREPLDSVKIAGAGDFGNDFMSKVNPNKTSKEKSEIMDQDNLVSQKIDELIILATKVEDKFAELQVKITNLPNDIASSSDNKTEVLFRDIEHLFIEKDNIINSFKQIAENTSYLEGLDPEILEQFEKIKPQVLLAKEKLVELDGDILVPEDTPVLDLVNNYFLSQLESKDSESDKKELIRDTILAPLKEIYAESHEGLSLPLSLENKIIDKYQTEYPNIDEGGDFVNMYGYVQNIRQENQFDIHGDITSSRSLMSKVESVFVAPNGSDILSVASSALDETFRGIVANHHLFSQANKPSATYASGIYHNTADDTYWQVINGQLKQLTVISGQETNVTAMFTAVNGAIPDKNDNELAAVFANFTSTPSSGVSGVGAHNWSDMISMLIASAGDSDNILMLIMVVMLISMNIDSKLLKVSAEKATINSKQRELLGDLLSGFQALQAVVPYTPPVAPGNTPIPATYNLFEIFDYAYNNTGGKTPDENLRKNLDKFINAFESIAPGAFKEINWGDSTQANTHLTGLFDTVFSQTNANLVLVNSPTIVPFTKDPTNGYIIGKNDLGSITTAIGQGVTNANNIQQSDSAITQTRSTVYEQHLKAALNALDFMKQTYQALWR